MSKFDDGTKIFFSVIILTLSFIHFLIPLANIFNKKTRVI